VRVRGAAHDVLSGQQSDGSVSSGPSSSVDGRYVAYDSAAANLVPGDTNDDHDAFVPAW
jgi:hypothetical protein